jgi:Phospholipase_D-nuclease N-terminal
MIAGILPSHVIILLIILLITAFWLWMLVDCRYNKYLNGTQKVLWFLLILFTHIIGAILYALLGRSNKKAA